ncbi:putative cytochrome P450 [Helianthus annuus]|nr:putative cytochrome P450 [Helianthus annuus]KAJ0634516.1 putative cytochrome P450 [Helianthus annuus]
MWLIAAAALVVVSITHWVYRWRNPRCNGNLPPGSMGWPLLGETIQFFAPNPTWDTPPFVKERMKRYGAIFKTNLVGRPVIVSTDSDLNYMIFQQEGQLFQSWYPDSFTEVFGRQNVGSLHGYMYKYLKNMVLYLFGPESLKKMLHEVEHVATTNLHKWAAKESVDLKEATANVTYLFNLTCRSSMIFDLTAKKLISYDPEKSSENLRESFVAFIQGLISFPLDIPGTAYHKCLQGRKKAMTVLKNMLEERRANPRKLKTDFFDYVLEELDRGDSILTEAIALDLMFVLLFASFETTSLAITVAVKLLRDNPRVLQELTEEHENILRNRENTESGLTWKEYKSMTFTFQLINETVRLANIVPGVFRKALKDIKFKDYTIPAGWAVMVCPPAVHLNPANYKDPLEFNPWRWKRMDQKGASKNFMAFGGGMRFCVGTDFTKVQMAVFLHCLVTKYRWKTVRGGEIVRTPGLQFPNGFQVQMIVKDKQNQDPTSECDQGSRDF